MLAMAVSAVQTVPALLEYFSYGGGPAAYAALFLAGQAAQLGLLACLFFLPGAKLYFSVCGRNGKKMCIRDRGVSGQHSAAVRMPRAFFGSVVHIVGFVVDFSVI